MPKVIYTHKKGLRQVAGSGFEVQQGSFSQVARVETTKAIVHTLVVADDSGASWAKMHDVLIVLYDGRGNERKFVINIDAGTVTAGYTAIAIGSTDNEAVFNQKLLNGIIGIDSDLAFAGKLEDTTDTYTHTLYALDVGSAYHAAAGTISSVSAGANNTGFVAGTTLTVSSTDGNSGDTSANGCNLVFKLDSSADVQADDSARYTSVSNSSAKLTQAQFPLAGINLTNGTALGQKATLTNASSHRFLNITGSFHDTTNGDTDNNLELAPTAAVQLVWNGNQWAETIFATGLVKAPTFSN